MLRFSPRHALFIVTLPAASKANPRIIRNHADYNGHFFISVTPSPLGGRHPAISIGAEGRRGNPKDEAATTSKEDAANEHGKK